MERISRSARLLAALATAAAIAIGPAACKKARPARAPDLADDIDAIEAELARKDGELASEGITLVARRDVTLGGAAPESPAAPAAESEAPPAEGETQPAEAPPGGGELVPPAGPPPAEPTTIDEEDAPELVAPAAGRSEVVSKSERRRFARERKRSRKSVGDRCTRVCELAQTTCELRDRVCGLAAAHEGEARYQNACAKAEDQCTAASEACSSCAA
jgi:hypothetical protein